MRTTVFFEKRVGWKRYWLISILLLTSFVLDLIVSLPTIATTPRLSGIIAHSTVPSPYQPDNGGGSVPISIAIGPAGGCMWSADQRQCQYTTNFQPSAEFLHLPSGQNVTNHFPKGRLMVGCHITTAVQAMGTAIWAVGPYIPGLMVLSITFLCLTIVFSLFSGIAVIIVSALVHHHLEYSVPPFDFDIGIDWVLSFAVVAIQMILAIWVGCIRLKMPRGRPPPPEDDHLEMSQH
ncbi:uncharacterized protein I303_102976 [Kwoniella dejecticola CBS 10117]|uniref:Pali-domain-containing protein n=1 Tax=Kwoniella dejecticola CBS 10117 TaxID=1296121 RepID=A0AAJ8KLS9_9TREE